MTDATTQPAQPSVEQLLTAFAASILPLAGPAGIAAAALIPAAEQLLAMFKKDPAKNYTVEELEAIVVSGNADLSKLQSDVDAQPLG